MEASMAALETTEQGLDLEEKKKHGQRFALAYGEKNEKGRSQGREHEAG
jgi:hypothetical protein